MLRVFDFKPMSTGVTQLLDVNSIVHNLMFNFHLMTGMTHVHLLALVLCITVPFSIQLGLEPQFQTWLSENNNKVYKAGEFEARAKIFSNNARLIEEHNSKDSTFKVQTSTKSPLLSARMLPMLL